MTKRPVETWNDLVGEISARLRQLGDMSMRELRLVLNENTTRSAGLRARAHMGRGELLEEIVLEEFSAELDREFEKQ